MPSWRESDDPRCPACGEKITATAAYCMHCEADFAADGSIIEEGTGAGADTDGYDEPADDFHYEDGAVDGDDTTDIRPETTADSRTDATADVSASDDYDTDSRTRSAATARAGEDFEATTLLLRGPISLLMGFPGAILLSFAALGAFGNLSATAASGVFLLSWFGVTGYLLRKPLASDAIGDGFYVYAGSFLAIPLVWFLGDLARVLLGSGDQTLGDAMVQVIFLELFAAFPALICLGIGYGANYYARARIESALNERPPAA